MTNKQIQKGGDQSVNVQGNTVTVGLSYTEARQVAIDVFEANFYRLEKVAADTARIRADKLVDDYLSALKNADAADDVLGELENPDMQYALYTAEREYARSGDAHLGELLVSLLVERTKTPDRKLLQIVLNEAIGSASKLTVDQLDILSLVFVLRYTRNMGLRTAEQFLAHLDRLVIPFIDTPTGRQSAYQHLEYAGCASIDVTEVQLQTIFLKTYPGLFCSGFVTPMVTSLFGGVEPPPGLLINSFHDPRRLQVAAVDDDGIRAIGARLGLTDEVVGRLIQLQNGALLTDEAVRQFVIEARPATSKLFSLWGDSLMKHLKLTSVGIAIGHANIQRRVGQVFDLNIWI